MQVLRWFGNGVRHQGCWAASAGTTQTVCQSLAHSDRVEIKWAGVAMFFFGCTAHLYIHIWHHCASNPKPREKDPSAAALCCKFFIPVQGFSWTSSRVFRVDVVAFVENVKPFEAKYVTDSGLYKCILVYFTVYKVADYLSFKSDTHPLSSEEEHLICAKKDRRAWDLNPQSSCYESSVQTKATNVVSTNQTFGSIVFFPHLGPRGDTWIEKELRHCPLTLYNLMCIVQSYYRQLFDQHNEK